MLLKYSTAASAVLGLGLMALPAQAAPLHSAPATYGEMRSVEKSAAYCWRRNGVRHCGYAYGPRYRTYGFPQHYRTGSGRWWQEMDRDRRGGRR